MFSLIFNKIAKAGNLALACRLLILLGGQNHQKSKTLQKCYILKQNANVLGGFCEITENASREVVKNISNYCSFCAPGENTKRLRFSTPLMLFGHFVNFWNPDFQKGQIPLEG